MSNIPPGLIESSPAATLQRAHVIDSDRSSVRVELSDSGEVIECELLATSPDGPPLYGPGDRVLAWIPAGQARGVLIGRLGGGPEPAQAVPDDERPMPDELVLEARSSLTLRVGEGSITLLDDGRVLIKGKDLVSHARRMNRIRGGAVSIN